MPFPKKKSEKSLATAPKELVALGEIGGIGDALQVYTYKPFGQLYNEIDPQVEHLFTGMPYDSESGFHYMTNRYYDAETGAFTRPDPILDGLNHYSYVGGNPIMYTDPTGVGSC